MASAAYSATAGLPFDESRATVKNESGRVVDAGGAPVRGVYCAGWIKRGPTGVIGTNKKDAAETVELLLEDARAGLLARDDPAAPGIDRPPTATKQSPDVGHSDRRPSSRRRGE